MTIFLYARVGAWSNSKMVSLFSILIILMIWPVTLYSCEWYHLVCELTTGDHLLSLGVAFESFLYSKIYFENGRLLICLNV